MKTGHALRAAVELRRAREAAGLTQEELGERAGVSQVTISMYEAGRRDPSLSTFVRLLEAAGGHLTVETATHPVSTLPATRRGRLLRRRAKELVRIGRDMGVTDIRVFGSTARGEDRPDSDIDLVVDLASDVGIFGVVKFAQRASELLHAPVDVVPYRNLKERIRRDVDADAIAL